MHGTLIADKEVALLQDFLDAKWSIAQMGLTEEQLQFSTLPITPVFWENSYTCTLFDSNLPQQRRTLARAVMLFTPLRVSVSSSTVV
jgi:hypothetical protein